MKCIILSYIKSKYYYNIKYKYKKDLNMTKIILISAITAGVLTTISADFSMGDMFKDMRDATISMSKDAKDTLNSLKDGTVETSKSVERTITNVSSDSKDISIKVSDDLKTSEIATFKDSKF